MVLRRRGLKLVSADMLKEKGLRWGALPLLSSGRGEASTLAWADEGSAAGSSCAVDVTLTLATEEGFSVTPTPDSRRDDKLLLRLLSTLPVKLMLVGVLFDALSRRAVVEEAEGREGDLVGVFLGVLLFAGDFAATSRRDAIASSDLRPLLTADDDVNGELTLPGVVAVALALGIDMRTSASLPAASVGMEKLFLEDLEDLTLQALPPLAALAIVEALFGMGGSWVETEAAGVCMGANAAGEGLASPMDLEADLCWAELSSNWGVCSRRSFSESLRAFVMAELLELPPPLLAALDVKPGKKVSAEKRFGRRSIFYPWVLGGTFSPKRRRKRANGGEGGS